MRTPRADHALTAIAPQSKLIRVIEKLCALTDAPKTTLCQQHLEQLNLRHSLYSPEGRLEFIADLITETKDHLNTAERRALCIFGRRLCLPPEQESPFIKFSAEYLQQVLSELEPDAIGSFVQSMAVLATRPLPKAPAAGLLLALALGALTPSGCAQKKPAKPVQAVVEQAADSTLHRPLPLPARTYVVKRGDSVRSIAQKTGIGCQEIVTRNNIKYDPVRDWFTLHPGQVLELPAEPVKTQAQPAAVQSGPGAFYIGEMDREHSCIYHLISMGQTLSTISKKYHVSVEAIASANNISDVDKITYGAILRIPVDNSQVVQQHVPFAGLSRSQKVQFLKDRTVIAGHPFIETIVDMAEDYQIDPRLYAALIWEESWFNADARSADNCIKLVQLDPRFHAVSHGATDNFRKSLHYLRHEFTYYRQAGFDSKAATICALAAYNGGNTRIRRYIKEGIWDGKSIETIPLKETRDHLLKIAQRCQNNYHACL